MKFLNRKIELDLFTKVLNKNKPTFIIVYGRRRIGKSTLIRKALNPTDVYYMAQLSDESLQRELLAKTIAQNINGFDSVHYPNWDSLFENLSLRVSKKTTLCLDEFPYMVKASPGLPSAIQKWLDLNKNGKCSLVICGSSQQMMQGFAFDSTNPLYGRASKILKIDPLLPGYLQQALKTDPIQAVEEYSIWGGVPRYWELREDSEDLPSAISDIILNKYGVLHQEPIQLFLDDMRESVQAFSIMSVIGSGANRLSEISARLGKPSTQLSRPLDILIQLGYLIREIPFGENPKNSKRSLYKINDPFLAFYFKLVVPNMSALEQGAVARVKEQTKELYKNHISSQWENLCRMAVPRMQINGHDFNVASRWWNNQCEFDLVAESIDGKHILVGECKWSDIAKPMEIINQLKNKIIASNIANRRNLIPALFVKSTKLKTANQDFHIFTPTDIMKHLI